MRIWLIQIGEPLPIDGEAPRLLRTGIMASLLAERGHDVTWWCTTFNHWTKSHRFPIDTTLKPAPRYRLRLLHSPGYSRNVSIARIVDHRILARRFRREIEREATPDLILCSFPTIEMAEIATRFARKQGIPVIVDVRDVWPDAFLNFLPSTLKPLGRLLLRGMYRQARRALKQSDAIVAVSESYLQWGLHLAQRERSPADAVFPLGYQRANPSAGELQAAAKRLRNAGVDPDRTICWFIGTFGRTYDIATVIEVARRLQERNDHRAQFVLSGDGGRLEECRDLAAGVDNVVFTGWLNSTEIEWMMTAASIGLAAYVRDAPQSLPNKIFEYLSAGLPVVSSLGDEAARVLMANQCGVTYTPGDPDSLLRSLRPLLEDPALLAAMSSAAQRTFDDSYSTQRIYDPFIDALASFGAR
ncbi:MAG: glycosyltransferase family 4 protein [Gemmatimonadaceae bacterium]